MTIDWDKVADDAENTPRGVLAAALGEVDDFDTVIVIATRKPLNESGEDEWFWQSAGSPLKSLGALRATIHAYERHVNGEES